MGKWFCIAPMVLLAAGCSKTNPPAPAAQAGPAPLVAAQAASGADPEPVERSPEPAPGVRAITIPSGTPLHVRVDESIGTRRNRAGDRFDATLSEPIEVNGRTMVPAGTVFSGHVITSRASGRLRGRAALGLKLDSFRLNGRDYRVETTSVDRVSAAHKKRNGLLIGGGAGLGAAIGAIAGGPAGALIGAGAGAGAGTAGAAATGKRQVAIRAETPLRFTLRSSVEM